MFNFWTLYAMYEYATLNLPIYFVRTFEMESILIYQLLVGQKLLNVPTFADKFIKKGR